MENEALTIGVYIGGYDFWKSKDLVFGTVISAYLVDRETGDCIAKDSSNDPKNLMMSAMNSLRQYQVFRRPPTPREELLLRLEQDLSSLNSDKMIFMFDISKVIGETMNTEAEKIRIAWAFLVPAACDGSKNIDKKLELQLYKVGKNCKISHQTCNIYHLYKDHKRKKFSGILNVHVKGVKRQINGKAPEGIIDDHERDSKKKSVDVEETREIHFPRKAFGKWSRLPTQSCKIPNHVHKILSPGQKGCSCLRFSTSGNRLAVSSAYRISVYNAASGTEELTLNGHNGFVYAVDWSHDDAYLLSVSSDCTCIVWNLNERSETHVLPHPSFVYCGKWLKSGKLITGCRDHLMRSWEKTEDGFELVEEIRGHSGFITSLALHGEATLISGDSNGCVAVHARHDNKWMLCRKHESSETSLGVIDGIHVCGSGTRIIATSRSKGSFMIDLTTGIVVHKYRAAVNAVLRSVPCLTPCGSLFFAFCHNGEVGVWNAHTGKRIANYENLFPIEGLSEICGSIDYSPFEHMIAIAALDHNYPVLVLTHGDRDDSKKLGLKFEDDDDNFLR